MGNKPSSSSTSKNTVNQVIVSKNTVNQLNEQINSAVANTCITQNKKCSQNVDQSQTIDLSGCKVGGSINITNTKQQQTAVVDLSCVQASSVSNEMAQEIMNKMMAEVKSNLNSESLAAMAANAESSAKAGFLSTSSPSSNSTSINNYNLNVTNDNTTNIQNVIKNAIDVEFNVEDVQQCVNQASQKQKLSLAGCSVTGNINISEFSQEQGITSTTNCLQQSNMSNKITAYAGTMLGVVTEGETTSKSSVSQTASAASAASAGGIGDICTPSCSGGLSSLCLLLIGLFIVSYYMIGGSGNPDTKNKN